MTHLSLTGVQAFLREDLTRFCRDAPAEFTHPQRDVFCVFSGDGVQRLRDYLLRMANDENERQAQQEIDERLLDGVDSPGADTMSEDGTIDGNDQPMDPLIFQRRGYPHFETTPQGRPRPRSMHEMSRSFHVDLPLFPSEQMSRVGIWTPGTRTPEPRFETGLPHLNLISSHPSHVPGADTPFDYRSRSPGPSQLFEAGPSRSSRERSVSRTPSRRHTFDEASPGYYVPIPPPPPPMPLYSEPTHGSFEVFDDPRRSYLPPPPGLPIPQHPMRPGSGHLWSLGMRSASDIRQTYLRPERDFSAFDANHEAIMSTIPLSRGASRHPSRSNSPHPSRVSSRSRLGNLLSGLRPSVPFSYADAVRGIRRNRSRDRSRMEEEEHREAMWRAMAEADAAQQLRPNSRRGESERSIELPLLHPDMVEAIPRTPVTATRPSEERFVIRQSPLRDANGDVNMTQ